MEQFVDGIGFATVTEAAESAPWLVLVHGISQDRRVFDWYIPHLAPHRRLLLVDLPGHGASRDHPGPFGIPTFSAAIATAIDAVRAERPDLWATHLGAASGLMLAAREPGRFRSLMLEGPVIPGRRMPEVSDFIARIRASARQHGMAAARALWWEEGGWFAAARADPVPCRAAEHRAIIEDFAGAPWRDDGLVDQPVTLPESVLARLDLPCLIMNGSGDMACFLDAAQALVEILPRARRAVTPGGGGFPLWEVPEQVLPLVRAHLGLPVP